jgi:general secretion pathway protein K
MKSRRGVALLAALWLVVAISVVALQFSLDARDRRTLGVNASERGIERAAALGALALTQARLEQALRVAPSGTNIMRLRAADPWLDADSVYSGVLDVDSIPVTVRVRDLGASLNVNQMNENELRTFFQFAIGDFTIADQLAQSIMDWRDADSIPRPRGGERDAYIKAEKLALPTNAPFREVTDLAEVLGVTPEIYARVSPYLRVRGSGLININTAPPVVLRALPGMTDATLNYILQMRSQGRRISDPSQVFGGIGAAGRPRPGQVRSPAAQAQLENRMYADTRELELTITAQVGPQAHPIQLIADLVKAGTNASIQLKQW